MSEKYISKLPQTVKEFLFRNVTDRGISKFVLNHDGQSHETFVAFNADGSDVTIQTEDECWTEATETWLRSEHSWLGPGIPMPGPKTVVCVYIVRHT